LARAFFYDSLIKIGYTIYARRPEESTFAYTIDFDGFRYKNVPTNRDSPQARLSGEMDKTGRLDVDKGDLVVFAENVGSVHDEWYDDVTRFDVSTENQPHKTFNGRPVFSLLRIHLEHRVLPCPCKAAVHEI
jgi:hypothetical protein